MKRLYYSKFEKGFGEVVKAIIKKQDKNAVIKKLFDDSVLFFADEHFKTDNLCFKSSYMVIDSIQKEGLGGINAAMKHLLEKKNLKISFPKNVSSFKLVFLKENDIIFGETGIIPHGLVQMKLPNNVEMHTQTLWGSIGWATPATFGACIANPNSRVILFTGEGSHQLTALEIGSMVRYGVKPIVLVLNNNGYTIERILSNDPDDKFNDVMKMNYSKFARAFEGEIWATRVETPEDFDKALRVTQIMNKLCYIELCVDKMDIPQLTKDVIAKFVEATKKHSIEFQQKSIKKEEDLTLNSAKKMNFSTITHESLRSE